MGVLKTLTDEYFGDSIRKEDKIPIGDLDVEIVKFKDNNGVEHKHGYRVKNGDPDDMLETLKKLIERIIEKRGNECSLNDIDVSNQKHMEIYYSIKRRALFKDSTFDGDISGWDVSNVERMSSMFYNSRFTGKNGIFKLEKGNKVENMGMMFYYSDFNGNISGWDVSNVKSMSCMFSDSKFNGDINNWVVNKNCDIHCMFNNTQLKKNNKLPKWYLDRQ